MAEMQHITRRTQIVRVNDNVPSSFRNDSRFVSPHSFSTSSLVLHYTTSSPCFPSCAAPHLTKRQKNWIRSTQPCMVNTSKGGRLPFSTICRLWAMSSHLCSQYHSIIAVCKMLLTAIWNILSKLVPYTPVGFLATPHAAAPSRTLTISQGLSLLRHRGYILVDDPALPVP